MQDSDLMTSSRLDLQCRSMYGPLEHVLLKHPSAAFQSQGSLDQNWKRFGYASAPLFSKACSDFDRFVECLSAGGSQPHFVTDATDVGLDSIYVRDPVVVVGSRMIFGRMGKPARAAEPDHLETFFEALGWPKLGSIDGPGSLEGGDVVWLDDRTLAVGVGYRSNLAGVAQLRELVRGEVDAVVPVPLPHHKGPDDVLHLMSLFSPVGPELAVVYRPLLPVPFLQGLEASGTVFIDVPDEEFESLGCNVLALSPEAVLMAEGNPATRAALERRGLEVLTYPPEEISIKGHGGPTCLTLPLVRR